MPGYELTGRKEHESQRRLLIALKVDIPHSTTKSKMRRLAFNVIVCLFFYSVVNPVIMLVKHSMLLDDKDVLPVNDLTNEIEVKSTVEDLLNLGCDNETTDAALLDKIR